jgi:hypothetical protein
MNTDTIYTILSDKGIVTNRPDIVIVDKINNEAFFMDIAVPNSNNFSQTYNIKGAKYECMQLAIKNQRNLNKIMIFLLIISVLYRKT